MCGYFAHPEKIKLCNECYKAEELLEDNNK